MVIKIYILLCSQRIGLVEDIVLQTLCGKILLQAGTLESRDSSPRLFLSHPLSTNKCSPLRHLGLSKFNRDIVKKKKKTLLLPSERVIRVVFFSDDSPEYYQRFIISVRRTVSVCVCVHSYVRVRCPKNGRCIIFCIKL